MRTALPIQSILVYGMIAFAFASITHAADLSPGAWPPADRERVDNLESQRWYPLEEETIRSDAGIVSATVSPRAVYAGIRALRLGGNAADAAATCALTQVTTQLGSVVSYSGVFTMLYYDARTHKVYSMDAGYNSYLQETDPASIPATDLGLFSDNPARKPAQVGASGRQTLVPGFMAGVEAMHHRFGHLPFGDLFAPAIWYAGHGIRISPTLETYFVARKKDLSRTPEGQQFLRLAGVDVPKAGDLFVQADLAKTLKAVSENGSSYMYTGQWAEDFVRIVRREGGKATADDLKRYQPIWSEPYQETAFGHTVYVNGPPQQGVYALFAGLNLAEALQLDEKGSYWTEPQTFQALARINQFVATAPFLGKSTQFLQSKGIEISATAQLGKEFARAVAPLMGQFDPPPADNLPKHSNAIVAMDRDGNIAVITHTINCVVWGDTGIVVDGIPLPDSAGFQQATLATIEPGHRVPHQIIDTIAFEGEKPILATASVGSSLIPESIRVLLGILGQHQDLATMMSAPPLLHTFDPTGILSIPQDAYPPDYLAKLRALGLNLKEESPTTAAGLRGTLAAVAIDPKTGRRTAVNEPGVIIFNGAE